MATAIDRALEARTLAVAVEAYAAHRGAPGSSAYRLAWVQFRQGVRTVEDLEARRLRWRRYQQTVKILGSMMALAQRIDAAPMATAQLVDRRTGNLRLVAQAGFGAQFCDYSTIVERGLCSCGSALAKRDPRVGT